MRSSPSRSSVPAAALSGFSCFLGLRERHLFTRGRRLRLRYAALPLAWFCAGSIAWSVADAIPRDEPVRIASGIGLVHAAGAVERAIGSQIDAVLAGAEAIPAPVFFDPTQEESTEEEAVADSGILRFRIGAGDTIAGLLERAGLSISEAYEATAALARHLDPRDIQPGQTVSLELGGEDDGRSLSRMEVLVDSVRSVVLSRSEDEGFGVAVTEKELHRKLSAHKAVIRDSLYASAVRAGIPPSVIADAIRLYSYDVDFQRDVQPGDSLEVMYDSYATDEGKVVRGGNILYASLTVGGREIPVWRFTRKGGDPEYYTQDGKTIRKSLLRTPIDGARVSSGYGMRRHPILGYSKMHKGVDFAAPTGTPIYASGAGTVEKVGYFGGYGKYVRLRHNGSTKTAYGHLSRFAKGLQPGTKVRQGQVIGYVGSTGRSTGPHLHYEVLVNNAQVNPGKFKMAQGDTLGGKDLKAFRAQIEKMRGEFASLSTESAPVARIDMAGESVSR